MPQPGVLGKSDLTATNDVVVYTTPASTVTSLNVNICNRSDIPNRLRVSIGTAAVPAATDYIECDVTIEPYGVLERTALVMGPGEKLIVRAAQAGITVRAMGFEEAA